eukprot:10509504-Alexandrium_andersonii.AAC.1
MRFPAVSCTGGAAAPRRPRSSPRGASAPQNPPRMERQAPEVPFGGGPGGGSPPGERGGLGGGSPPLSAGKRRKAHNSA